MTKRLRKLFLAILFGFLCAILFCAVYQYYSSYNFVVNSDIKKLLEDKIYITIDKKLYILKAESNDLAIDFMKKLSSSDQKYSYQLDDGKMIKFSNHNLKYSSDFLKNNISNVANSGSLLLVNYKETQQLILLLDDADWLKNISVKIASLQYQNDIDQAISGDALIQSYYGFYKEKMRNNEIIYEKYDHINYDDANDSPVDSIEDFLESTDNNKS